MKRKSFTVLFVTVGLMIVVFGAAVFTFPGLGIVLPTSATQMAHAASAPNVPIGNGNYLDPNIPVSHRDRVYTADQYSNTVSVTDPVDNKLLGVINLGGPTPGNVSPLYTGQLLVHGMGFSPDHRTLVVVSIGSNSVSFIDTATNTVKHITYEGAREQVDSTA